MRNETRPANEARGGLAVPETAARPAPAARGAVLPPSPSLPRGDGAVRGLGEKFATSPVTGTASLSIPLCASPGRSGFGPQLPLAYDSGAANGVFGFGWHLQLPAITRKTDKGLPRYDDAADSDVFILSGAEDLVPEYRRDAQGAWLRDAAGALVVHEEGIDGYSVRRYRPRVEGLHARIERWSRVGEPADVHWRSISRDNVLTLYGLTPQSRIADPADPARIFSWLVCETRDDRGNAVLYRYKAEDGEGVALDRAHQRNRGSATDARRSAMRYPKRVLWGNRDPLLAADGQRPRRLDAAAIEAQVAAGRWMFELVFDYGEHHADVPLPRDDEARDAQGRLLRPWPARPDAFSSYRAGFEVRTARRCRRALMFHHFPAAADVGRDCVVRSTEFRYVDEAPAPGQPADAAPIAYSQLGEVTHTGWRRTGSTYRRRSLPPLALRYTQPRLQEQVSELDADSARNMPQGLDGALWRLVDLHGEGLPGLLTEQASAWFYKRNLSPLPQAPGAPPRARFAPLELVASKPNAALAAGADIMDLAGDGQADVVMLQGPTPGLYEHDGHEGWGPFRAFASVPVRPLRDPLLRFTDLDGDGHADLLVHEDEALVWHRSLAEAGFGPALRVPRALDEELGPRVAASGLAESRQMADMSGDGLQDIVRIRNGEVSYWPNLGHGRFGERVCMDNAPWFDHADQFDPARLRLVDIDGTGTTDLVYLHRDGVRLYFNLSGNAWSAPRQLAVAPPVEQLASVDAVDLLGTGTACLVWSSPLPRDAGRPLQYLALLAEKPHLLAGTDNNLGAETHVEYAPATRFYLADKAAGRPWITRLPFPVHVVERVWTLDHVARTRFCTRYAYHHGYFDGVEREFRGFGMVEQWDTEEHAALLDAPLGPPPHNLDPAAHLPPVHTRTWFHTGAWLERDVVSQQYEQEYFHEPGPAGQALLPDTPLPPGLDVEGVREACRALKGSMLRQEVYAEDAPAGADAARRQRAATPYSVTEQNFGVRELQPRGGNPFGVFVVEPREALSCHYERVANDPRVQHTLTLQVNEWGQVLREAQVAYGRRQQVWQAGPAGQPQQVANPGFAGLQPADVQRQCTTFVTYGENAVTRPVLGPDTHRAPLPCDARNYELTGFAASGPQGRYRPEDFVQPDPADPAGLLLRHQTDLPYEGTPDGTRCRRLLECLRTLYRDDALGTGGGALAAGALPLGQMGALALPFESYQLAFTPGLLQAVFRRTLPGAPEEDLLPDPAAVLGGTGADQGGYVATATLKSDGRFPAADPDGGWWLPSGRAFHSEDPAATPAQELAQARRDFFVQRRWRDPFGHEVTADFDADLLLLVQTRDALGNTVRVLANDYRVLQPRVLQDANGNRSEVAFDALGLVTGTAVAGKAAPAPAEGDSLSDFEPDLTDAQRQAFLDGADPLAAAPALLGAASSRIVHDLDRFSRSRAAQPHTPDAWQPAVVATLARETHALDPLPPHGARVQLTLGYSDGFGREIQKKLRAEPGPLVEGGPVVQPRWVCSGWTVFNNKGLPVRQYEPFFTGTTAFEFGVRRGVSAVLFYDPTGRAVATLHPNRTYEKVVFDAWTQRVYDVSDTVAARNAETGDPRTDPHVGELMRVHLAAQGPGWMPWHAARIGGALGPAEQQAAQRAEQHADTPTRSHLDAQGRVFLVVARNRVACPGHPHDGQEQDVAARTEFDIEGNVLAVRDGVVLAGGAQGRLVMRHAYDVLGRRLRQASIDAGERWTLPDVAGQSIRSWDARGHLSRSRYDALRRITGRFVRGQGPQCDPRTGAAEVQVERVEYGEAVPGAEALNLRLRVYRSCDGAGVLTHARLDAAGQPLAAYDFKGNPLHVTRELASDPEALPDWAGAVALLPERFESSTRYDALNRVVQSVAPHSSIARARLQVVQPRFNEAGLLEAVDVWLQRAAAPAALLDPAADPPTPGVGVSAIDYDASGQRRLVRYANGASTHYRHDEHTHRLLRLYSRRAGAFAADCANPQPPPATQAAPDAIGELPHCGLQNLRYTYDPAGNLTHLRDDAQQALYLRNQRVDPDGDYVYDALYRLVQARGREQLAAGGQPHPHGAGDGPVVPHPGDGNTLDTYVERYVYDAVGNLQAMQHRRGNPALPGWTRDYAYEEASLLEDGSAGTTARVGNRLTRTTLAADGANPLDEAYAYDAHGNLLRLPHLAGAAGANLHWDHSDRLRRADLGGGGTALYVYDAGGQRVRKVWRKAAGLVEERIYLGGFEIFRRHEGAAAAGPWTADSAALEREALHLNDDQRRIAIVETRTHDVAGTDDAPARLVRYQLGNHLGSASLELDEQAQIVSYEEYAPYGSSSYQARRSQQELPKRYRFTGKERDEETGLYYHGARYYAPWLGRWTRVDPSGLRDGLSLYAYVRGNPVRLTDPSGREGEEVGEFQQHGKAGGRSAEITMDIDEPRPVGEKGLSKAQARARALDVNNRQFLDFLTNRYTKHLGVDSRMLNAPIKPAVSVTENPYVLLNRRFGEITEMQKIFDQAARSVKNPDKLPPTKLKNRINSKVWDIIKTGNSPEAQAVRGALQKMGFQNVEGKGFVLRPSGPPPEAPAVKPAAQPATPAAEPAAAPPAADAPEAPAAKAAAKAAPAAAPEVPAAAAPEAPAAAPKAPVPEVTPPARPTVRARVRAGAGTGLKVAGALGVAVAAKDVVKDVREGNYGRAAATTGMTAAGFTPLAPVVIAVGVSMKYHTDPTIEQRAFSAGDWAQEKTGSVIVGGVASAGAAVGLSFYEAGADLVKGVKGLVTDW